MLGFPYRANREKVVRKFPSRVIFVVADKKSQKDSLITKVSILPSSKGDLMWLVISFISKPQAPIMIHPFMVLPQICPIYPSILFGLKFLLPEDPLSQDLEKLANRLIFDSESTHEPSPVLQRAF